MNVDEPLERKKSIKLTVSSSNHVRKDRRYNFWLSSTIKKWLWCPLCLPMIFVITPPLSDYCTFRTGLFLCLVAAIRWNTGYWRRARHALKNASWSGWLYALVVPRLWPTRIERHCDNCETILSRQFQFGHQKVGWQLRCLRRFPWRILSRHWGHLAHTQLRPRILNTIIIWAYIKLFDCKLHEAQEQHYETLGDFFCRRIKPACRPVHKEAPVVSPADGQATWIGPFEGGFLQQVKGVHYSLSYFLGLEHGDVMHGGIIDPACLLQKTDGSTDLYQAVIYLSPGDYHRFHSPVDWTVTTRRHFPGELLSVKPSVVSSCPGLFHLNERVSWLGQWDHGFFSMTAVGATNVGSIHMEKGDQIDPELKTNRPSGLRRHCDVAHPCSTRTFFYSEKTYEEKLCYAKGQPFGHFTFGSTIVLLFEAPKQLKLSKSSGDRLLVGEPVLAL